MDRAIVGTRKGQVHLTLSRAGLTDAFYHFLTNGAEFDVRVASELLGGEGLELLSCDGAPYATRELIVSPSTAHPNSAWVAEQTEAFLEQTTSRDEKPAIVMHDRDMKFTQEFIDKLMSKGVRHNALPKASPNLNGRCERVIFTLKHECLKKFIIFGKRHLDHLMTEFTQYYNTHRSHTATAHLPPLAVVPEEVLTVDRDEITVRSYVGGLVRSFER